MNWRARAKAIIPPMLVDNALLKMPILYRTKLVNYEANMGPEDLGALHEIIREVVKVDGDLIECGSSRCGSAAITALWLRDYGANRRIFACDSFRGFDPAELRKEQQLDHLEIEGKAFTSTNKSYVLRKLRVLGLDETIVPIEGYFEDTLTGVPGPFCYALIDCDLEESMEYCARVLLPKLSPGGWMVFHDYESPDFKGAKRAVDRFVKEHLSQIESHEARGNFYVVRSHR